MTCYGIFVLLIVLAMIFPAHRGVRKVYKVGRAVYVPSNATGCGWWVFLFVLATIVAVVFHA